jgi:DNA primase large subunit
MFKKVKRRTHGRRNFEGPVTQLSGPADETILKEYPDRISFYKLPPTTEITLDQFETYAIDRLKILIEINNLQSQGTSYIDTMKLMSERVKMLMPLHPLNTIEPELLLDERRKDHYSHFILRLAFCRSEELRKKFISSETFLFKLRYSQLTKIEKQQFISKLDFIWAEVSDSEKESLKKEIIATHFNDVIIGFKQGTLGGSVDFMQRKTFDDTDVWECLKNEKLSKLPWDEVPDLVANRKVFIHKGYSYVPEFLQMNLLANEFSKFLDEQLLLTLKLLPGLDEDERLIPILDNLSKGYNSSEFQGFEENAIEGDAEVNANNVKHFENYFPACARRLMDGLEEKHHLRYTGRQQFTLFLKGIGLGPNEALKFWQKMFTSGAGAMTIEKFTKEYKYNIKHSYGLEGARINYKPWGCSLIMSKPKPNKQEYHGCPYRDLQTDNLSMLLKKMGMKDDGNLQKVIELSDSHEYQAACTRVFEVLNNDIIQQNMSKGLNVSETPISHPNEYFHRSIVYERNIKENA